MKDFVVFYAWQSDRPANITRSVIRDALELAAKNITSDPTTATRLLIDSDTQGVLGHVPVIDTIIDKIKEASAFVPDLTFVAETDDGKHIPNPNVLLEYGYALSAKTHSIMIPVMNVFYGPPEKLPFDMGHRRHPLKFELSDESTPAERQKETRRLARAFEEILRLMIAASTDLTSVDQSFEETRPARAPAFFFPNGHVLASAGFPDDHHDYSFDGESAIYVRLFPKYREGQPRIGRAGLKEIFYHRRVTRPMTVNIGGLASANDFGWIAYDPASNTTTRAITQGFPSGELWGVNSQVFLMTTFKRHIAPPEAITAFGIISAERIYTKITETFLANALIDMQLKPPFVLEIGAVGLRGAYMGAPHREFVQGYYYGPIRDDKLVRRYEIPDGSMRFVEPYLSQYFNELYDLAELSRNELLTDEYIQQNGLPPRLFD